MAITLAILFIVIGRIRYKGIMYKYFWKTIVLRVFMSLLFAIMTINITGGDSTMYYTGGRQIAYADWATFFDLIFSINHHDWEPTSWDHIDSVTSAYMPSMSNLMVAKLVAIPTLFFDSFIFTTIVFGLLSFLGTWKIFQTAFRHFPDCYKNLAYGILFFPSCIYWSSGIGKDAICLFGLGILISSFDRFFIRKQKRFTSFLLLLLSASLIFVTKSYILVFFSSALLLYLFANRFQKIKNYALRVFLLPMTFFVLIGIGFFFLTFLTGFSGAKKFALENVLENIATHQSYSKEMTAVGNNTMFDLGTFEPSLFNLITFFPKATFTALYRPFFLESMHPLMVFLSIENLLILFLSIRIFFRFGFTKLTKFIFSNNYLLFCLFVAVFFSGFIAISTNNFGTLSRYRLPCMPFFATLLAVLLHYSKKSRRLKPFSN